MSRSQRSELSQSSRSQPTTSSGSRKGNFKKVLKKAGILSIRFQDLRHTFASQLLCSGANILYVSQQLGHSNPGVTMKVYAKWIPKEGQREAMNKLPFVSRRGSDLEDERLAG